MPIFDSLIEDSVLVPPLPEHPISDKLSLHESSNELSWNSWKFEHYECKPQERLTNGIFVDPKEFKESLENKENVPNQKCIKLKYQLGDSTDKIQKLPFVAPKNSNEEVMVLKGDSSVQVRNNKKFPDDMYTPR